MIVPHADCGRNSLRAERSSQPILVRNSNARDLKPDNQVVNVRTGGNYVDVFRVAAERNIQPATLSGSRGFAGMRDNAIHFRAIGKRATFPSLQFCLGFQSLMKPKECERQRGR
jgi:hypothetical protein